MGVFTNLFKKIAVVSVIALSCQTQAAMTPPDRSTYENDPSVQEVLKFSGITIEQFAAVVNFYSKSVYQTVQEYYVYNWFSANGRNEVWKSDLSAYSSSGWDHFVSGATRHWKTFCPREGLQVTANGNTYNDCEYYSDTYGSGGMAGSGLYAALDPASTRSYGGTQDWVLMQIKIPKKYRIINSNDLYNFYAKSSSSERADLFFISSQITNIYNSYNSKFGIIIRKVLKDILKVDALIYSYNSSLYNMCSKFINTANGSNYSQNVMFNYAFVFLTTEGMPAKNVKVFNQKTSDATDDRKTISKLLLHLYYYSSNLWTDIQEKDRDAEFVNQWAEKNAFGCQKNLPYEDIQNQDVNSSSTNSNQSFLGMGNG